MTDMNKQPIYDLIEDKMLNYTDYATVPVEPINESFVSIPSDGNLVARQIGEDMRPYTGEQVYVRRQVRERLSQAADFLTERDAGLRLEVRYGYRALEIQQQLFEKYKAELSDQYSGDELLSRTHKLIAVPEVAGHPAGAAVDIQIVRDNEPLEFGTKIWEFQPDSFTFSPFISKEGWTNRQLLRQTMIEAGFAPFDGEWWHFSYGDKEWAKYYDKPAAMYEQVNFNAAQGVNNE